MIKSEKQKTILVTGGAGFVGSNLCAFLLRQGHRVICLDNFFTGSRENIKEISADKNFRVLEQDVVRPLLALKEIKIDEIYNLASPASPIHYQYDPFMTVKTNVLGAMNLLELAKKNRAKILQASTSEIYGDPLEHPQKETYLGNVDPLSPRGCYDEGKRIAETIFMDYWRRWGVRIKIVRIFNTYGPKMSLDDGRVVSNFFVQALRGEDLTIYGDGQQTRSFQYIDDLVAGLTSTMASPDDFIGPVNLGNPEEVTIKEIAQRILKLIGSESRLVNLSLPQKDPRRRQPDISLAKEKLDWEPKIKLDEGLERSRGYFVRRTKELNRRVLIFSLSYEPFWGGAEIAVKDIVKRLEDIKFDMITARFRKDLPAFERIGNVDVYRVGWGISADKYLFPFLAFWRACRLYRRRQYRIIWAIMANYAGLAALFFRLTHRKVKYLLTLQEGESEQKIRRVTRWFYPLYRLIYRRADFIQAISQFLEARAWRYGFSGPSEVVPNGVDLKNFSAEFSEKEISELKNKLGIKPEERVVITTGRLVEKNANDDLIKALEFLPKNIKLIIMAVGPEREKLDKLAVDKGLGNRVVFGGFVPHDQLVKYLRLADVFVRPSLSEGLGNSFLEAMAVGVPVVGTAVGGIKDFLRDPFLNLADKPTGLFCAVRNPQDIADKIEKLLVDKELCRVLTANASALIKEKYDWQLVALRIRQIFSHLLL